MRGKHIQIAFPVESLKQFAWNQGLELIRNYDSIIGMQQSILGWKKEGIVPAAALLQESVPFDHGIGRCAGAICCCRTRRRYTLSQIPII